ncbi:conjugal transfer protein TraD, partial [Bacteroides fragilis]|nr:conjugal transfer protein TraD [Bacteroides fragilis]
PDAPRASGSSFDEIDDAVRTAKKPEATATERERAAKVFTDMEGTELYEKLMTGSSEMSIRIKGLIEIRLKKPKKDFVVPDNIEDFDIRDYV